MSKVLLVDDEAMRLEAVRQALARGGFETVTAADGNAGLRAFLNELPDLVLVGPFAAAADEAFCRWVRETRPGIATPIVLYGESLSGAALKLALEQSRCNAYVEVPATDEHLIEVCLNTLGQAAGSGSAAASGPVFDAQDSEDIDSHLDSMFETGAPPPAPPSRQWDAEPEVSFETDRAALSSAASGAIEFDPNRDLIGFDPDQVAFEGEGEIQPGALPDAAVDSRPFVEDPVERADAKGTASPVPPPVAAEVAIPTAEPYAPGLPGMEDDELGSVDFALEDPPELSESRPHAQPTTGALPPAVVSGGGSSKAMLYGAGAFIALVGAAGLFLMLRPSTGGDDSIRTAAVAPATAAPRPQAARPIPPPVPRDLNPAQEPEADMSAEESNDAGSPDLPAGPGDATPADDALALARQADAVAIAPTPIGRAPVESPPKPARVEPPTATVAVTQTAPPPQTAAPATTTAPAAPAVAPTPKPHHETIFVPSSTVLDAATAGPGFTPPRAIDRVDPVYAPGSVPAGGESVTLRVLVNEWGKVVRVDIEKGRAGSALVEAAVSAALGTRYRPAKDQGNEVRAWTTETFRFD